MDPFGVCQRRWAKLRLSQGCQLYLVNHITLRNLLFAPELKRDLLRLGVSQNKIDDAELRGSDTTNDRQLQDNHFPH